jgi:hypothetical protein
MPMKMEKTIHIDGQRIFQCPIGWTVEDAEKKIRSCYVLNGGLITKNGIAARSADLIMEDGEYAFVNALYITHILYI